MIVPTNCSKECANIPRRWKQRAQRAQRQQRAHAALTLVHTINKHAPIARCVTTVPYHIVAVAQNKKWIKSRSLRRLAIWRFPFATMVTPRMQRKHYRCLSFGLHKPRYDTLTTSCLQNIRARKCGVTIRSFHCPVFSIGRTEISTFAKPRLIVAVTSTVTSRLPCRNRL